MTYRMIASIEYKTTVYVEGDSAEEAMDNFNQGRFEKESSTAEMIDWHAVSIPKPEKPL